MREIGIETKKYTKIYDLEAKDRGPNKTHHCYEIHRANEKTCTEDNWQTVFAAINFQNGPIKENGVNGCHNEDLIAIVIDRLQSFQNGNFSCRENAIAITKLEEALLWLNKRTQDRINRNVEGTSVR